MVGIIKYTALIYAWEKKYVSKGNSAVALANLSSHVFSHLNSDLGMQQYLCLGLPPQRGNLKMLCSTIPKALLRNKLFRKDKSGEHM